MLLEVVAQSSSRHEHAVGQLLVVRVPLLCWSENLAEVVNWALEPVGLAFFWSFDHEYCADHLMCGCYVQQQGLALFWRDQNGRGGEEPLEAFECVVGFWSTRTCLPCAAAGKMVGPSRPCG